MVDAGILDMQERSKNVPEKARLCGVHGTSLQPMQVRVIYGSPVMTDSFMKLVEDRAARFPNAKTHVLGGCQLGSSGYEVEALVCLECRAAEREWEEENNLIAEPEIGGLFIPGRKPNRDRAKSAVLATDPNAPMKYKVCIDDIDIVDDPERFAPEYDSAEEAIAAAKAMVDAELKVYYEPKMTSEELYESYELWGEDPFIASTHPDICQFSALDYAKERCEEMCSS